MSNAESDVIFSAGISGPAGNSDLSNTPRSIVRRHRLEFDQYRTPQWVMSARRCVLAMAFGVHRPKQSVCSCFNHIFLFVSIPSDHVPTLFCFLFHVLGILLKRSLEVTRLLADGRTFENRTQVKVLESQWTRINARGSSRSREGRPFQCGSHTIGSSAASVSHRPSDCNASTPRRGRHFCSTELWRRRNALEGQ